MYILSRGFLKNIEIIFEGCTMKDDKEDFGNEDKINL
jgi:hypothetical protein